MKINVIKRIRKQLGRWKCVMFDQWPYRRAVKGMAAEREKYLSLLDSLPPILPVPGDGIEVHMLCGKRDLDMGVWASWSLFRYLDGRGRLFVHSDGTLDEAGIHCWRKIIPDLELIERPHSQDQVHELLSKAAPVLYNWSLRNLPSIQLIDMHLFGSEKSFLVLDTDVLFFSKPDALLQRLTAPSKSFAWCRDLLDAYSSSVDLLQEVTGVKPPSRVNHGVFVNPRLKLEDFLWLEGKLEKIISDGRLDLNHFWSPQTYIALLVAEKQNGAPLPEQYSISTGRTRSDQILRHYVGIPKIRFRYFREGVPRILKQNSYIDLNL